MTSTTATARQLDLAVSGMTCASCAMRIERKLNKLDGVTDVQIDFPNRRAIVTSDTQLDDTTVRTAVADAGYEVTT